MTKHQKSTPPGLLEQTSSALAWIKLCLKCIPYHPSIASMAITGPTTSGALALGQEVIKILTSLSPNLIHLFNVLSANKEESNIDELYECIRGSLDNLLNKHIDHYNISLTDLNLHTILNEPFIKTNLLPLFLTLRDVPKLCHSIKERNFLQQIRHIKEQLTTHIEISLHHELRQHLTVNNEGLYTIDDAEPALVSQIKKIVNALIYAEKILLFINSLDTQFDIESFLKQKGEQQVEFVTKVIWYLFIKDSEIGKYLLFHWDLAPNELAYIAHIEETIHHVRQIQSSLLDIDLPLEHIFATELSMFQHFMNWYNTTEQTKTFASMTELSDTLSAYVGKSLGFFIHQLNPSSGTRDFSFLTHHLGLAPGYLDQLTQLIYSYGTAQKDKKLTLTQKEHDVFQSKAIQLFFALNHFDQRFFLQKATTLLFPVRTNLAHLGQSIQQQAYQVNTATQELITYQLARIKNKWFAHMMCESDKLELYLGLVCGTFTQPLMLRLNELYQHLVSHASFIVDLQKNHPDLIHLDNASFLAQRIQHLIQQKNECQTKYETAKHAIQQVHAFTKSIAREQYHTQRSALQTQYQAFKSYVITFDPALSVLLDNALNTSHRESFFLSESELNTMKQTVIRLATKEKATYSNYVMLSNSWLQDIPKQSHRKLSILPPQKTHSLLIINEHSGLQENTQCSNKQHTKEPQYIKELTALSLEERAELYTYHAMRISTLQHTAEFITQLIKNLSITSEGSDKSTQNKFNKKHMSLIINQYKVIQPYLVDNASHNTVDEACVTLFNQFTNEHILAISATTVFNMLTNCLHALTARIQTEIKQSERRSTLFQQAHHEKTSALLHQTILSCDSELVQRQDKWIRQQTLSRSMTKLSEVLHHVLAQMDPCLKIRLTHEHPHNTVPFPEMEDPLTALTQTAQTSWAKRLINIVHYIQSTFNYLESLDRNVQKKDAVRYILNGPLIEGLYQMDPFLKLAKASQCLMELNEEPIKQLILNLFNTTHRRITHQISLITVHTLNTSASMPLPSWLVSLILFPEQLMPKESHNEQTKTNAQKMASAIEHVLKDITEKHYLHLLMHSPHILFTLLPTLFIKLSQLATLTQQLTLAHLNEIQTIMQHIIQETDAIELRLGLRIGLLSQTSKLFLDKLFYHFIEPLDINLSYKAQLIGNTSSFKQRIDSNRALHHQTTQQLQHEKELLEQLTHLLIHLKDLKTKLDNQHPISPMEQETCTRLLRPVHHLLHMQKKHYPLSLSQQDKSSQLDDLCHQCLNLINTTDSFSHEPRLEHVLLVSKHVHAAKKGVINSLELKITYLNAQLRTFSSDKEQFIQKEAKAMLDSCMAHTINMQMKRIGEQAHQLVYLGAEYHHTLLKTLHDTQTNILKKIDTIPFHELEHTIYKELQQNASLLHQDYLKLCHLDAIVAEIEAFQAYCQKEKNNPLYENINPEQGTLMPKIILLNKIKTIAQDTTRSVNERIKCLQKEAKKESFYTILMSQEHVITFEWNTLKRLLCNLLHRIFNCSALFYHPEDKYHALVQTIHTTQSSLKQQGFFARTTLPSDAPENTTASLITCSNAP